MGRRDKREERGDDKKQREARENKEEGEYRAEINGYLEIIQSLRH